jgi:hypothetical protein
MAVKSKLKAVEPKTAEPKKPKILIYGKPGVGKTWASLDFPNVYYIDSEGGANLDHYTDKLKKAGGIYLGVEQGSLDFDTIIEQVQALATETHSYKTLVIDSISKIYNTAISNEAERLGDKDAFGASKKPAVASMRRLINWLSRIDMNVILISHEKSEWGMDAKGQRVEVGATFDAWDKMEYELDLCLNVFKVGGDRKARVRKSRLLQFPDATVFPWSYDSFADKYGRETIEKKAEAITLATDEQLAEIKRLLSVVKLPDGQEDKWLKSAGVDGWEEMSTERISKAIEHINKTFLTKGE